LHEHANGMGHAMRETVSGDFLSTIKKFFKTTPQRCESIAGTNWTLPIFCREMNTTAFDSRNGPASVIQGQVLRLSERREVAIYLHNDALWVADFVDGHGEIIDALTWFRFNCGTSASPHARRRMVLESGIPLTTDLVARIERLHDSADKLG